MMMMMMMMMIMVMVVLELTGMNVVVVLSANDRVALYVVVHICTESTPSRCRSD